MIHLVTKNEPKNCNICTIPIRAIKRLSPEEEKKQKCPSFILSGYKILLLVIECNHQMSIYSNIYYFPYAQRTKNWIFVRVKLRTRMSEPIGVHVCVCNPQPRFNFDTPILRTHAPYSELFVRCPRSILVFAWRAKKCSVHDWHLCSYVDFTAVFSSNLFFSLYFNILELRAKRAICFLLMTGKWKS